MTGSRFLQRYGVLIAAVTLLSLLGACNDYTPAPTNPEPNTVYRPYIGINAVAPAMMAVNTTDSVYVPMELEYWTRASVPKAKRLRLFFDNQEFEILNVYTRIVGTKIRTVMTITVPSTLEGRTGTFKVHYNDLEVSARGGTYITTEEQRSVAVEFPSAVYCPSTDSLRIPGVDLSESAQPTLVYLSSVEVPVTKRRYDSSTNSTVVYFTVSDFPVLPSAAMRVVYDNKVRTSLYSTRIIGRSTVLEPRVIAPSTITVSQMDSVIVENWDVRPFGLGRIGVVGEFLYQTLVHINTAYVVPTSAYYDSLRHRSIIFFRTIPPVEYVVQPDTNVQVYVSVSFNYGGNRYPMRAETPTKVMYPAGKYRGVRCTLTGVQVAMESTVDGKTFVNDTFDLGKHLFQSWSCAEYPDESSSLFYQRSVRRTDQAGNRDSASLDYRLERVPSGFALRVTSFRAYRISRDNYPTGVSSESYGHLTDLIIQDYPFPLKNGKQRIALNAAQIETFVNVKHSQESAREGYSRQGGSTSSFSSTKTSKSITLLIDPAAQLVIETW